MTQASKTLPRYFKDASGFCYVATAALAARADLTAWDGAVDAAGYATEAEAPKRSRSQARRVAVQEGGAGENQGGNDG